MTADERDVRALARDRDLRGLWARGQHGFPARYPLVQFPNAPLIVSVLAGFVRDATSHRTADVFWAVGRVALAIWAYEELARGTNAFRRVLGAVMLVVIVRQLADR